MNIDIKNSRKHRRAQELSFMMLEHDVVAITNYGNTWTVPAQKFFSGLHISIAKKTIYTKTGFLRFFARLFGKGNLKPVNVYNLTVQMPSDSEGKTSLMRTFVFFSYHAAQKFRDSMLGSLAKISIPKGKSAVDRGRPKWLKRILWMIIVSVLGLLIFVPSNKKINDIVHAYHTEHVRSDGYLDEKTFDELKKLAGQIGVVLNEAKKSSSPFYILSAVSDCEDCRNFDILVSSEEMSFQPVVLPMISSSDNSGELLAALGSVYCSENRGNAWVNFMSGSVDPGTCKAMEPHILSFVALSMFANSQIDVNASQTFIVVAPNGAYHLGKIQAENPLAALEDWLTINTIKK